MRRELSISSMSPTIAKKTKAAGFTFTEVIVASSLMLLAMVPILRALTQAHLGSVIIERRSRCLTLAQTKLDEVKARSIYNWDDDFNESDTSLDGAFLCDVTFQNEATDLKRLTVSVGYDQDGSTTLDAGEIEITLITLVARRWGS
jgi:Tfp pilus assembly protein PilV